MNRPSTIGILIIALLAVSGYVSSSPKDGAPLTRAAGKPLHLDPHVSYYEAHLIAIGIKRRDP